MLPFAIFLLCLGSLPFAQLQFLGPPSLSLEADQQGFNYEAGKKFHSLAEAISDGEKIIERLKEAVEMPSLVFAISVKGKTVYEKAWGWADLENSVPATLTTKYRLASISKTFTSMLVGRLVDQGLLKYEDLISQYLPSSIYPPKTWKGAKVNITLAQLLSHTAGTHVTDVKDMEHLVPGVNCTQMIHKFASEPLHFAPGSNMAYSNYGFQLVGAIIESVTKKSYPEAMGELFQKLGLNSTYVERKNQFIANRARYYSANGTHVKENIPGPLWDDLFIEEGWWPSGGLMSTAGDLIKYGNQYLDAYKGRAHALLSKATLSEMWTPRTTHVPGNPFRPTNEYGYGWLLANVSVAINPNLKYRTFNWHSGGLLGVTTFLVVYPEQEMVAAVLTNKGYAPGLDNMAIYMAENIYQFF